MRIHHGNLITALIALTAGTSASAEWRCDCTSIVGSCTANATVNPSFVEVTSNVTQCARVDYFVDGIPFVALVVDGMERQDWIAQSESPAVIIQSCQVCLDNTGATVVPDFGTSLESEGDPTRLITVDPDYPADAAVAGIEGYVDVQFEISGSGTVAGAEVVAAEPPGVFDVAALAAVNRWRYTRPPAGERPLMMERIEFDLGDAIFALTADRSATPAAVRSIDPQRNNCVREDARFDFGTMVDISLINACSVPLLVYRCSAGTGPDHDRWICNDPERTTTLLQPALHSASGAASAEAGLTNVGRLEITRAPNSEYWWLACTVDDGGCRDEGRQWIRSMNGQIASIDPQNRTRVRLARSY